MGYKSVATLDIRSASVSVVIGERGVNHTFVFRGAQTEGYDGYGDGKFFSEKELKKSVFAALTAAEQSANERHNAIYVSVPGAFTKIVDHKHLIAFSAAKRITEADKETLFRDGYTGIEIEGYERIYSSALYFITSDSRKVVEPNGIISTTLQANICYMLCSTYFTALFRDMLKEYGYKKVYFIPSSYAQANYLLSAERRNECAVLLDMGVISSTISVVYGNGILREETLPFGEGNILFALMSEFDWSYERAAEELKKANMFRRSQADAPKPYYPDENYVPPEKINEVIAAGLDELCEPLGIFLDNCPSIVANRAVLMTGEGIIGIRGGVEHLSKRLNRESEIVAPTIPYYNKPSASSRIALLDYATKNKRSESFLRKLFKGFGG
jgi:cell division ATPase FtsA